MKKLIKRVLRRSGYTISAYRPRSPTNDPFVAIRQYFSGTDNQIIFDVGAHHGFVSKKFRALFPTSTIYAFEPFKESFESLAANVSDDNNIHAYNFGLSDQNQTSSFYSNTVSETNSIFSTHPSGKEVWGNGLLETKEVVDVQLQTLDAVIENLELRRIDILKLDVQGAEYLVMNGARESCKNGKIDLIYSEIIIQPTYNQQQRFDEALAGFYDLGFDLLGIYNLSHTKSGRLRQIDVIFTSNK